MKLLKEDADYSFGGKWSEQNRDIYVFEADSETWILANSNNKTYIIVNGKKMIAKQNDNNRGIIHDDLYQMSGIRLIYKIDSGRIWMPAHGRKYPCIAFRNKIIKNKNKIREILNYLGFKNDDYIYVDMDLPQFGDEMQKGVENYLMTVDSMFKQASPETISLSNNIVNRLNLENLTNKIFNIIKEDVYKKDLIILYRNIFNKVFK